MELSVETIFKIVTFSILLSDLPSKTIKQLKSVPINSHYLRSKVIVPSTSVPVCPTLIRSVL